VSTQIVVPPGGAPVYFAWDRPIFKLTNPDVFPAAHGPNNKNAIIMGWGGDYANDNPNFMVAMVNNWGVDQSGYSSDGGATWSQFASIPPVLANFVWVPNNNGVPYYTTDGGVSWKTCNVPGVPTTGETGWGWAYYLHRYILVADKVTAGTFYLYNYLGSVVGLYRSTDGGANWTRVYSKEIAAGSSYNAKLYSVPGQAGHLFFTSGNIDGASPANTSLMRSTDGGVTWSAVPNALEVYAVGFGKAATGSTYPAIFIAGYINNTWGIWRSDDNAVSWVNMGANPLNNGDLIKTGAGDMSTFGRVYVGFGGSGGAYCPSV
jgi:hypothetical protein